MSTSAPARRARSIRTQLPVGTGGLILVGGPPLHGKSVLAAQLADMLPFAHKLEAVDNLRSGLAEHWLPRGIDGPPQPRPLRAMLEAAVAVWLRHMPRPVVIVAARAATPAVRRLAHRRAVAAGMKFLFVECHSRSLRAFQRLSAMGLPKDELLRVMARYDQAVAQFVAVDRVEMTTLPAVRLDTVLADVDGAARAVLARWATL